MLANTIVWILNRLWFILCANLNSLNGRWNEHLKERLNFKWMNKDSFQPTTISYNYYVQHVNSKPSYPSYRIPPMQPIYKMHASEHQILLFFILTFITNNRSVYCCLFETTLGVFHWHCVCTLYNIDMACSQPAPCTKLFRVLFTFIPTRPQCKLFIIYFILLFVRALSLTDSHSGTRALWGGATTISYLQIERPHCHLFFSKHIFIKWNGIVRKQWDPANIAH